MRQVQNASSELPDLANRSFLFVLKRPWLKQCNLWSQFPHNDQYQHQRVSSQRLQQVSNAGKQRNLSRNFQVKLIMKDARQYHWPTTQHWSSSFQNRFVPVVCVCVCVVLCVLLWLYKGRRRNCMNLPPGLLSFMTPRDTCKATKTFKTRLIQNKPFWFWQLTAINSYSNTDGFAPNILIFVMELEDVLGTT